MTDGGVTTQGVAATSAPAGASAGASAPPHAVRLSVDTVAAGLCVVLVATRLDLYLSVTAGTAAGLALAPVVLPALQRFRGATALALLGAVALITGAWLTAAATPRREVSASLLVSTSAVLVELLVGIAVLLWARTRMAASQVALLFGTGLTLVAPLRAQSTDNPWRFGYSIPLTVLLLALTWRLGRRWLDVVVALALSATSALNDGRSTFAMLLLTAVLVVWRGTRTDPDRADGRGRPGGRGRARGRLRIVVLTGLLGFALLQLGQSLILDGYLGEATQERTAAQMATGGSVLTGARPEYGATVALLEQQPLGYGAGTLPAPRDVVVAKAGMAKLNYDPDNGYVERYMFGSGFTVHSVLGDAWIRWGLPGAALALLGAWHAVRHLSGALASRTATGLGVFLGIRIVWDLLFSPFYSSVPLLTLALGLMLPVALGRGLHHADADAARGDRRRQVSG